MGIWKCSAGKLVVNLAGIMCVQRRAEGEDGKVTNLHALGRREHGRNTI